MKRSLALLAIAANAFACARPDNSTTQDSQSRRNYVWYCDAESDPDYAVADIVETHSGLFARLTQESGDGDEGGFEIVPVSESVSDDSYTYSQRGTARLENGRKGKTEGFEMVITATDDDHGKIDADGYLALESGPTGAETDENNTVTCRNYRN